jgi:hypothetical protein
MSEIEQAVVGDKFLAFWSPRFPLEPHSIKLENYRFISYSHFDASDKHASN